MVRAAGQVPFGVPCRRSPCRGPSARRPPCWTAVASVNQGPAFTARPPDPSGRIATSACATPLWLQPGFAELRRDRLEAEPAQPYHGMLSGSMRAAAPSGRIGWGRRSWGCTPGLVRRRRLQRPGRSGSCLPSTFGVRHEIARPTKRLRVVGTFCGFPASPPRAAKIDSDHEWRPECMTDFDVRCWTFDVRCSPSPVSHPLSG